MKNKESSKYKLYRKNNGPNKKRLFPNCCLINVKENERAIVVIKIMVGINKRFCGITEAKERKKPYNPI